MLIKSIVLYLCIQYIKNAVAVMILYLGELA